MFAGMDPEGEEFEDESDDNDLDTDLESDESNPTQLDLGGHDWAEELDKTNHSKRKVSVKSANVMLPLKGKARKTVVSGGDLDELDLSDSPSVGNVGRFRYHDILPSVIDFHHLGFDIPLVTQAVNQVTPKLMYKQGFLTIRSNVSFEALHEKLAAKFNVYPGSLKLQWSLDPKLETISDLLCAEDLKDLIDRVRPLIVPPLTAKGVPSKAAMKKISVYILNAAEPTEASNGIEPIGKVSEHKSRYHA
jgi:hypothetical protein